MLKVRKTYFSAVFWEKSKEIVFTISYDDFHTMIEEEQLTHDPDTGYWYTPRMSAGYQVLY